MKDWKKTKNQEEPEGMRRGYRDGERGCSLEIKGGYGGFFLG